MGNLWKEEQTQESTFSEGLKFSCNKHPRVTAGRIIGNISLQPFSRICGPKWAQCFQNWSPRWNHRNVGKQRQSCLILPGAGVAGVSLHACLVGLTFESAAAGGWEIASCFWDLGNSVLGWERTFSTVTGLSQSFCHWEGSKSTGLSSLGLSELPTRTHS